jgi:arginine N-succinyltransferase
MFLIREARPSDLEQLLELGRTLDSINLPTDTHAMARAIERSQRAFRGSIRNPAQAVYLFCAEEIGSGVLAGASMIIAKHGTPEAPHYYMEIGTEERYSHTLRKMLCHTFLRLRYSMDGPTELGGLIVAPAYRGHPQKVGKQLSWVRFLYIGKYRERFQPEIIAEIMPPKTPAGSHLFWDHYGGRVTGLSFKEADRLSARDKEFIRALFPDAPLYTFLLPEEVRASIGAVSEQSRPAVALLERAGLRFLEQIDPFDGGPYYGAPIDELVGLKHLCSRHIASDDAAPGGVPRYLVARDDRQHGFRAVAVDAQLDSQRVLVRSEALEALKLRSGELVDVLAFPEASAPARSPATTLSKGISPKRDRRKGTTRSTV